MATLQPLRWIVTGALVVLACVAILFARSVEQVDEALARAVRYDIAWSAAKGRFEALQLEKHVARYAATGDPRDAQAAETYREIFSGRLRTWDQGEFRAFVADHPRLAGRMASIRERAAELDEPLARLAEPDAQAALLASLSAISRDVIQVAAAAHTISITDAATIREELELRQAILRFIILGLLGAGVLLLALTTLQNRSLARARAEAQLHAERFAFVAQHDSLTGLPNRAAFADRVAGALAGRRTGARGEVAVLAMDLDGFKAVNDSMGHGAGDALLASIARRLREEISAWGEGNVAARFGGDEFAILLVDVDERRAVSAAERLRAVLRRPHELPSGTVTVDATFGVAVSGPGSDAEGLWRGADLALTAAKAAGKGLVLPFHPDMRQAAARRLLIERDLPRAIRAGDLRPAYQPKIDLLSGRVVGFEALARWRHPEHGPISPVEFVPIAEASGAIVEVGEAILARACRDAAAFPPDVRVAVNVSVVQLLRSDLPGAVERILARTGLAPARLQIEVTESVMMGDASRALAALGRIKALGVRVALDDFGTGFSALAYLQRFEWDELKIDRAFVRNLESDPHSRAIVAAVTAMARDLDISVVAEGVETCGQRDLLVAAGCRIGQGYLFSPPIDAAAAADFRETPLLARTQAA